MPEEGEVEHRRPLVTLEQDERRERDQRDGEGGEDAARRPAVVVGLDEPVRQREQPDRRRREARQVEALLGRVVTRLVDEDRDREQSPDADRDVDEEDPVPVDVLGQEAADKRADRERHRRDAGPDADRLSALARRERRRDDRERRGVHERPAEPLHDARADQEAAVRRETAREARSREDREPEHEDQTTPDEVGELAAGEHEGGEGERIPGDDPLELGEAHVQRAPHRGQRDVHDRVVEHDHEEPDRHRGERPPLLVLGRHETLHPHLSSLRVVSGEASSRHGGGGGGPEAR